jgi:hypothetical protein
MMEGRLRPVVRMRSYSLHVAHPAFHAKWLTDK